MIATLKTPGTKRPKTSLSESAARVFQVLLAALAIETFSVQCAVSEGTEQSASGFESPASTQETIRECFRNCSTEEFRTLYTADAEKTLSKESLLEDLYDIPSGELSKVIDNLHAVCTDDDIRRLAAFTHRNCDTTQLTRYMILQLLMRRRETAREFTDEVVTDLTANFETSGLYAACGAENRSQILGATANYLSTYIRNDKHNYSHLIEETCKKQSSCQSSCIHHMDLLQITKFDSTDNKSRKIWSSSGYGVFIDRATQEHYKIDRSLAKALGPNIGTAVVSPFDTTSAEEFETRLGYIVASGIVDTRTALGIYLPHFQRNFREDLMNYLRLIPHAMAALHCQWRLEFDLCNVDLLFEDDLKTFKWFFDETVKNGAQFPKKQQDHIAAEVLRAKTAYYSQYQAATSAEACQDIYFSQAEKLTGHKYTIVDAGQGE
ncbi:MAG: hypothetical protein IT350_11665 [Deltaproteobacteria bacterium]|nr:hypothetical protein [Deltaproteobacteria bacterium]